MTETRTQSSGRRIDVGVCVPTTGWWPSEFGRSLVGLFHYTTTWRPKPEDNIEALRIRLFTYSSSMLVASRQYLMAAAIADGCTHVLFLDDDMHFPKDTLVRLMLHDKPIVGVNCTTKTHPVMHIAHDLEGNRIDSREKTGLQQVQHIGFAVALIDLEIPKQMERPLFMMDWIPGVEGFCGEDVYFCAKAAHLDAEIFVDHDLSHEVLHLGKQLFGPGMIGMEKPEPKAKIALTAEGEPTKLGVGEEE